MANNLQPSSQSRNGVPCRWAGCDKSFTRNSDMERHVKNIHEGEKHHCPVVGCADTTSDFRKDKLLEHIKKTHSPSIEEYKTIEAHQYTTGSTKQETFPKAGSKASGKPLPLSAETTLANLEQNSSIELGHSFEAQSHAIPAVSPQEILRSQPCFPFAYITTTLEARTPSFQEANSPELEDTAPFTDWTRNNFGEGDIRKWPL